MTSSSLQFCVSSYLGPWEWNPVCDGSRDIMTQRDRSAFYFLIDGDEAGEERSRTTVFSKPYCTRKPVPRNPASPPRVYSPRIDP